VLKVKVHSAKLTVQAGIKTLLQCASEKFPRLSHLWLHAGYRGEDKDWVQKALGWSVELVDGPRKSALMRHWCVGRRNGPRKVRRWIGRNVYHRGKFRSCRAAG